jgi:hypothetical protein
MEVMMQSSARVSFVAVLLCTLTMAHAQSKAGLLSAEEVKKTVPSTYFFAGQTAPVQIRNSSGFRTSDNKLVLAGLVDTSGYAADVQQKYQGLLITETKLKVGDAEITPGQYGFGFSKDGRFMVLDVSAKEIASTASTKDETLPRPVPLRLAVEGDGYKLYSGKNWVMIRPE